MLAKLAPQLGHFLGRGPWHSDLGHLGLGLVQLVQGQHHRDRRLGGQWVPHLVLVRQQGNKVVVRLQGLHPVADQEPVIHGGQLALGSALGQFIGYQWVQALPGLVLFFAFDNLITKFLGYEPSGKYLRS